ncbi:uncharacterized protein LOC111052068 [Nilaparvata lugens]|uniref:uncharacterized protein LOC111052068 n=1 Tax=Nilaparvata lugens TaxID=108931 RepID=UPI00193D4E55|nr:uncharacterized protein LOC111052068 [Nilaparvata lugens]
MGTSALLFSLAMMATAYGHHASQAGIPGSEMYDKYSGKKYEGNNRYARQMPDMSSFTNPSQITNNFSPDKFQSMAKPDAIMSAFSGGASGSPAPAESASASEVKYRVARQMPDMSSFTNPQQITNNFSPDKFQSMAKPDAIMSAFSGGASGSPAPAESASASEVKYRVARQMPDMSSFTNPSQITNNFSPDKFQSMAKPDAIMSAFSGGASGSPAPAESASASEVKYRVARQMPDMSSFTNPQQITNNFSPDKFQSMAKPDAIMSAFSGGSGGGSSAAAAPGSSAPV